MVIRDALFQLDGNSSPVTFVPGEAVMVDSAVERILLCR
jgi:hypothetical protein